MAGLVEAFVTKHLPEVDVDFLTGLCDEFKIQVDDAKKDKKPDLLKLVLRYLTSDALEQTADHGAAVFLKLYGELGDYLGALVPKNDPTGIPPLGPLGGLNVTADDPVETLSYHKLRQCKIHGKIGEPGDVDTLSYTDLAFQMKQNTEQGYTDNEIYAAIIRATKAGNPLRELLEIKGDMDKDELITVLKSHFGEEEPSSVLELLRQCRQTKNESAHTFFTRAIGLKDKALKVQGNNFGANLVTDVFFKSLYTGLKQNNVRMELHHLLKEKTVSDPELLKAVAEACANEKTRLEKLNEQSGKAKSASVSHVRCDDSDSGSSSKTSESSGAESKSPPPNKGKKGGGKNNKTVTPSPQNSDQLVATVNKIAAQMNQLATSNAVFQSEINELKQQVRGTSKLSKPMDPKVQDFVPRNTSSGGRKIYRCNNCIVTNSNYCNHCWRCGSAEHKIGSCPLKNE